MFVAYRALVAILLLLVYVSSGPVENKEYLYLGPGQILELPSLAEVPCQQNAPFGPPTVTHYVSRTAAAVVPYAGAGTLMICGLNTILRGCYVWRKSRWELSDTLFNGTQSASSMLADGRWLVTGGLWKYDLEESVALSSARTYSEAKGWADFSPLPVKRYSHCQVTVGNAVYAIGGYEEGTWGSEPQSSVFILSDGQEWVKGESLPTPLSQHACAVMGSKIFVVGGNDGDSYETSAVYTLDSSSPGSSWELGPELPVQLNDAQAFFYDGRIYLLGGRRYDYLTDVFTLEPGAQSWSLVPGSNITDKRLTFPAPFITHDAMHCN